MVVIRVIEQKNLGYMGDMKMRLGGKNEVVKIKMADIVLVYKSHKAYIF